MEPSREETRNGATFRFRNLGPVTDAELELGDLTVIAGRNNTGKTYIVYTLYGFLKMWDAWPAGPRTVSGRDAPDVYRQLAARMARADETSLSVDPQVLGRERESIMERLSVEFSRNALAGIFSAPADAFDGASLDVDLGAEFAWRSQSPDLPPGGENAYSIDYDGERIHATGPARERPSGRRFLGDRRRLWRSYLNFLFPELDVDPFVLSAERFGISLFYKELDFTKTQIVDLLQKIVDNKTSDRYDPYILVGEAFSRYALPVKDNITYTRDISEIRKTRSVVRDRLLHREIRDMMDGYYKISDDRIHFVSRSRSKRRFNIPLHRASSSARELSDFYFFLRHAAQKNQILIIDEPESHLDTSNQILLARLLVRAVGAGLKILITTHSDYIVKEINNLIMLSSVEDDVVKKQKYELKDRICRDKIRAYVAENGGLTKCRIDRFGIDMPVFDKTIDEINRVANDLASRLPHDADD